MPDSHQLDLIPTDNRRLADLCGQCNENLKQVEHHLGVEIFNRGHHFHIKGNAAAVKAASQVIHTLYAETERHDNLPPNKVHLFLQQAKNGHAHANGKNCYDRN